MKIPYRPEIDGLRAIAVVAVILFHAEFEVSGSLPFAGGYLGVDVFFVISGFLISKIILSELESSGRFSFLSFYQRRVRRILPILMVVMLASIPFAWIYLLPTAFVEFAHSLLYSLIFVANHFFHSVTASYGAESSLLKPFLHTWSLSVEEQFYLLFPLLVIGVRFVFRKWIFVFFLVLATLSLLFAESLTTTDPDLSFYVLPTRAWQVLLGTMLAQVELRFGRAQPKIYRESLSMLGLVLMLGAFAHFDATTHHPGFITLIPVAGVGLLIFFAGADNHVGRLLGSKLLVLVGLISYSLYLWHFPIFAFARNAVSDLDVGAKIACIVVVFVLSTVSYRLIEQPCRNPARVPFRMLLLVIGGPLLAVVGLCIGILGYGGDFGRFDHLAGALDSYNPDNQALATAAREFTREQREAHKTFGQDGRTKVLVVGDSHGKDLYNALIQNKERFPQLEFVFGPSEHLISCRDTGPAVRISRWNQYQHADVVLVSFRLWERPCEERDGDARRARNVEDLVAFEQQIRGDGKLLAIANNTIEFSSMGREVIFDHLLANAELSTLADVKRFRDSVNRTYFQKRNRHRPEVVQFNERLAQLASKHRVLLLRKEDYLCDAEEEICFGATEKTEKAFRDYGHYTIAGARFFGERMAEIGWLKPLEDAAQEARQGAPDGDVQER